MPNNESKDFLFYAFISCNNRDLKWAKWIQKKLESYNLPSILPKEIRQRTPKKIQPIFLYTEDLHAGVLLEELKKNLERSKYLIVICSPNSAMPSEESKTHYVNEEVKYFGETLGRKDHIIPVIIDGVPNDPARECFCPKIKEYDLVGVDAVNLPKSKPWSFSRVKVLCTIVATILGLRIDDLIQRGLRRQRRRRRIVYIICFLFIAAGIYIFDYNRTKIYYYESFKLCYLEPVGVNEISADIVKKRPYSCRFTYRWHKLQKMEFINSRFLRRNNDNGVAEIKISERFQNNRAREMIFRNSHGKYLYRMILTEGEDGTVRAVYKTHNGGSYKAGSGFSCIVESIPSVGINWLYEFINQDYYEVDLSNDATEVHFDFHPDGMLKVISFWKLDGRLPTKYKGVREFRQNRISGNEFVTEVIGDFGIKTSRKRIEKEGRLKTVRSEILMNGESCTNAFGELIAAALRLESGEFSRKLAGVVGAEIEYDDYGNANKTYFMNAENSTIAEELTKYEYNSNGELVSIEGSQSKYCLNEYGDIATIAIGGAVKTYFEQDYYPEKTVKRLKIKHTGFAMRGSFISAVYMRINDFGIEIDRKGNPVKYYVVNNNVPVMVIRTYDDKNNGMLKSEKYFNQDGKNPLVQPMGMAYHSKEVNYDVATGLPNRITYRNTENTIIEEEITKWDVATALKTFYEITKNGKSSCWFYEYDDKARLTNKTFYSDSKRSQRLLDEQNVFEYIMEYKNDTALLSRLECRDTDGNKCRNSYGWCIKTMEYDKYGHPVKIDYWDETGEKRVINSGNDQKTLFPGCAGIILQYENIPGGRKLSETYIGVNGKPMLLQGETPIPCYGIRYSYNDNGTVKTRFYLTDMSHIDDPDKFGASEEMIFNSKNLRYGSIIYAPPFNWAMLRTVLKVSKVIPNSVADKNGIKQGDLILRSTGFDDFKINDISGHEKYLSMMQSARDNSERSIIALFPGNRFIPPALKHVPKFKGMFGAEFIDADVPIHQLNLTIKHGLSIIYSDLWIMLTKGKTQEALSVFADLPAPDFAIPASELINYAHLLLVQNKVTDAVAIYQKHRGKIFEDGRKWDDELLNALAVLSKIPEYRNKVIQAKKLIGNMDANGRENE